LHTRLHLDSSFRTGRGLGSRSLPDPPLRSRSWFTRGWAEFHQTQHFILMPNLLDSCFNPRENELAQELLTIIKAEIVEVNEPY